MTKTFLILTMLFLPASSMAAGKKAKKTRHIASAGEYVCTSLSSLDSMTNFMNEKCNKKHSHSISHVDTGWGDDSFRSYAVCCVQK